MNRVSPRPDGLGGAAFLPPLLRQLLLRLRASSTLSAPLFFNTEDRLFSRAYSVARIYAKIRNV